MGDDGTGGGSNPGVGWFPGGMNGLSPEELQSIMGLGEIPEKQALLQQQMRQAALLRGSPMPEGRGGGYGRPYTAPHPLEILGNVLERYAGYKSSQDINTQEKALLAEQTRRRSQYLNALLKRGNGPGTADLPPEGEEQTPDAGGL